MKFSAAHVTHARQVLGGDATSPPPPVFDFSLLRQIIQPSKQAARNSSLSLISHGRLRSQQFELHRYVSVPITLPLSSNTSHYIHLLFSPSKSYRAKHSLHRSMSLHDLQLKQPVPTSMSRRHPSQNRSYRRIASDTPWEKARSERVSLFIQRKTLQRRLRRAVLQDS